MAKRPLWRRLVRGLAWTLGVLVMLAVLALVFLHTPWGKRIVRGRIEARLAKTFAGGATLGSLDYGFLFSRVELGDLTINDATGKPAITIKSLHAALDRTSLLAGAPQIDVLAVEGLDVQVVEAPDGRTNLVGLLAASDRRPLSSIVVTALSVTGTATVTKADGTVVTVTDVSLTGSVDARPVKKEVEVTLGPVAAKLSIARPGAPRRDLDLAIATATVQRGPDGIDAVVTALSAGAVSIGEVRAHAKVEGGLLIGDQSVALAKVHVDRSKLRTLLGREMLVADVDADLTLAGPMTALVARGVVTTLSTKLALDGTIDLSNRLRPAYRLKLSGAAKSEDILIKARTPAIATSVVIGIDGAGATLAELEAAVTVEIGATTIGAVAVEGVVADLTAKGGAFTLDKLVAHGLGFEVRAAGVIDANATLRGRVTAAGEPDKLLEMLRAAGIAVPPRLPPLPRTLNLAVTASGALEGEIAVELEPMTLAIAGGTIAATGTAQLVKRRLVTADTTLRLRNLDLGALAGLANRRAPVAGTVSGTLKFHRAPAAQETDYDVAVTLPQATVHAKGQATATGAVVTARFVKDGVDLGRLVATLPLERGRLVPARPFRMKLDVPARAIAELVPLVPAGLRARIPADLDGTVAVHADLRGTPRAPVGTVDVAITGSRHGEVHAVVASGATGVVVTTTGTAGFGELAGVVHGTLTIPSLFTGAKLAIDKRIAIDQTIEIAERPIGALPKVTPKIAALGGIVGGRVHLTGQPNALVIDGAFAWRGYHTANGATGETSLAVSGSPTALTATVTHGAATIVADVTRSTDRIDIRARAHADETPLLPLVPALFAIPEVARGTADASRLRWDMRADIGLAKREAGFALDRASVEGTLAIHGGTFAIPNTNRVWHDIALEIAGDPRGIRLVALDVREGKDRSLHAAGLLTVENLAPTKLALSLATTKWLAFGVTSPLFTDAPTTEIDLALRVDGDLTQPIPQIDATIDALVFRAPDRKMRAHQPERISVAGDVIFVDEATLAGKLPALVPQGPLPGARPLDIRVHIPNPVHVTRDPLDVVARGEVTITVRPEATIPRGEVTFVSGNLNLFAYHHELVRGRILVSEEHPRGWLDLVFERRLPDADLRDLAGDVQGARLTLTGEPAKPQVAISGAVNATLPEVFSMYDSGHAIYAPSAGLPATSTVRAPRGDQTNIMAFISLALPHLLFLDRVAAWADASEPRGSYGRIRNLEADRYTAGDRNRVRAVARPTVPGRSTAELQLDHMFLHDARKALGIGVRAGDRLGGGVGLIFEWSQP